MKKLLTTLAAAGLVATAVAPAALATGPDTFGDYNPEGGQTKTEQAAQVKNARVNVKDLKGNNVAGVTVDFLVNGKASQAVTDVNGDATISAKVGDVVRYRVAAAPAGYFQNSKQEGSLVVGTDMFTNGSLKLEKTDSYNVPTQPANPEVKPENPSKPEEGQKPADNNGKKPETSDKAKKDATNAAAKAKANAAAGKTAGKTLPKTSAAK